MYNRTDFKRCAVQDEAILKGMFSGVIGLQFLLLFFKKLLSLPTFGMYVEFFWVTDSKKNSKPQFIERKRSICLHL